MRSRVLAMCMVALLAPACAVGTASPTPNVPTPTPGLTRPAASMACGGFHLGVINDTDAAIDVAINAIHISTIATRGSVMLIAAFIPEHPLLPWTVVAARSSDGTELGRAYYVGTESDQTMVVADTGARTAATQPCPNVPVRPPA